MSHIDDSTTGTAIEHPRVIYRSHELNERELEFAKAAADGLGNEWRVIVTDDVFYPEEVLYRIDVDSFTVEFLLLRAYLESRAVDFCLHSARAYETSDIADIIDDLNQKYGVHGVEEAVHDISLEMHKAIQNNSKGTLFVSLYQDRN
jgi:hypothetical protein